MSKFSGFRFKNRLTILAAKNNTPSTEDDSWFSTTFTEPALRLVQAIFSQKIAGLACFLPFAFYFATWKILPKGVSLSDGIGLLMAGFFIVILMTAATSTAFFVGWFLFEVTSFLTSSLKKLTKKIVTSQFTRNTLSHLKNTKLLLAHFPCAILLMAPILIFTCLEEQKKPDNTVQLKIVTNIVTQAVSDASHFIDRNEKNINLIYSISQFIILSVLLYFSVKSLINFRLKKGIKIKDVELFGCFLIFTILFLNFINDLSEYPLPEKIVILTGLAKKRVNIISDQATFEKIKQAYPSLGDTIGCKSDSQAIINNAHLIWHGWGDVSFIELGSDGQEKQDQKQILELPRELISSNISNPDRSTYCKDFSGVYFEAGHYNITNSTKLEIEDYISSVISRTKKDSIEKIEVEWFADPTYLSSESNYLLAEKRAKAVGEILASELKSKHQPNFPLLQKVEISLPPIESKGGGPNNNSAPCKDWPNKKTLNECLAKNRGGKITIHIKNQRP
ncbi:Outer membrane protein OmpA [Andreprevotia lacus DSM 23236]|jgi:outer membrane protein OmpA-like peptidoglycan-associated protein|uniref:Outer membrane protein OmpA n=1 Tax=Andreprevotia lacus DSM 23236 TaxID=1121001 RepID=A0A1W1X2T6_9NEIS|nr:hypothetical protein [Andreprevotia lacus]SMC18215.1 Outer membrane protein OmpA [Andreprevotia lacus DSM 23236]